MSNSVFDTPEAQQINQARMEHLDSLSLSLDHKSVLDVGCGIGYLAQFFLQKKCQVLAIDGRKENIAELKFRYPNLKAKVLDVETDNLSKLGKFEVVFCYGLLYHLSQPELVLKKLAQRARKLLLLETCILDKKGVALQIVKDPNTRNQGLREQGCRPTPTFVFHILKKAGFRFIYRPKKTPRHPDFQFIYLNDNKDTRDGHLLRQIFVVSHVKLTNSNLIQVTDGNEFHRHTPAQTLELCIKTVLKNYKKWLFSLKSNLSAVNQSYLGLGLASLLLFIFLTVFFLPRLMPRRNYLQHFYWWFAWDNVVKSQKLYYKNFNLELYTAKDNEYYEAVKTADKIIGLKYDPVNVTAKIPLSQPLRVLYPLYPLILLIEILVTSSLTQPYFDINVIQNLQFFINLTSFVFIFLTLYFISKRPLVTLVSLVTVLFVYQKLVLLNIEQFMTINESSFFFLFVSLALMLLTLFSKTKRWLYLDAAAGVLGVANLLRGEFIFLSFTTLGIALYFWWIHRPRLHLRNRLVIILLVLFTLPLLWGLRNIYQYRIPTIGRTQNWQHLYQNLGEYPNPWGIINTDEWTWNFVEKHGYAYGTFAADQFLKTQYFAAFRERPDIILTNFASRTIDIASAVFPLGKSFLLLLALVLIICFRRKEMKRVLPLIGYFVTLWLLMGFVLFGGINKYVYHASLLSLTIFALFIQILIIYVTTWNLNLLYHAVSGKALSVSEMEKIKDWLEKKLSHWPMGRLKMLLEWLYRPRKLAPLDNWNTAYQPTQVSAYRLLIQFLEEKLTALDKKTTLTLNWYFRSKITVSLATDVSECLFKGGYYEPNELFALSTLLKRGMTFVDIGAHIGLYTLFASALVGRSGKVIAFEPSSREYRLLRMNTRKYLQTKIFNQAISSHSTTLQLSIAPHKHDGHNTLGNFLYPWVKAIRKETVHTTTLDKFLISHPLLGVDVIKIDVEGHEDYVLKGAVNTLKKYRPLLLIEISSRRTLVRLRRYGYRFYVFEADLSRFVSLGQQKIIGTLNVFASCTPLADRI